MIFDDTVTLQQIAQSSAALATLGGVVIWVWRRLRRIVRRLNELYIFIAGAEHTDSLVERIVREEFRSRFILMHARDGVFECDAEGLCTYVNPTMAKLLGIEAAECLGNGWLQGLKATERQLAWSNATIDERRRMNRREGDT